MSILSHNWVREEKECVMDCMSFIFFLAPVGQQSATFLVLTIRDDNWNKVLTLCFACWLVGPRSPKCSGISLRFSGEFASPLKGMSLLQEPDFFPCRGQSCGQSKHTFSKCVRDSNDKWNHSSFRFSVPGPSSLSTGILEPHRAFYFMSVLHLGAGILFFPSIASEMQLFTDFSWLTQHHVVGCEPDAWSWSHFSTQQREIILQQSPSDHASGSAQHELCSLRQIKIEYKMGSAIRMWKWYPVEQT